MKKEFTKAFSKFIERIEMICPYILPSLLSDSTPIDKCEAIVLFLGIVLLQ